MLPSFWAGVGLGMGKHRKKTGIQKAVSKLIFTR